MRLNLTMLDLAHTRRQLQAEFPISGQVSGFFLWLILWALRCLRYLLLKLP